MRERYVDWYGKNCSVDCAQHELAKVWNEVTGDSYVVHVAPGFDSKGVAGYLAKYLLKDFIGM